MRVNQRHALVTRKVLLVPYCKHHVPNYHAWMQDPDLQAATASEPLKLDEEYAMQRSWRDDADKLTFIICQPLELSSGEMTPDSSAPVRVGMDDAPERMIGDINLFFLPPGDDDEEPNGTAVIGEIELMIARKDFQRKGYGRAALITFMGYIIFHWPTIYLEYTAGKQPTPWPPHGPQKGARPAEKRPKLRYLRVKIQQGNVGSIALFESIGFKRTASGPSYFREVELRWEDDGGFLRRLKDLPWMKGEDWEGGAVPYDENSIPATNGH